MDIFSKNPARKFGMVDITHKVNFCLLRYDFVIEIYRQLASIISLLI